MTRRLLTLALGLMLAGCTGFQLVPAGKVDMRDQISVETPIDWNSAVDSEIHLWTLDGPALQQMIFHVGVKDDKTLFDKVDHAAKEHWLMKLAGKERDLLTLRFKKSMTEHEIMDLFVATYTAVYNQPVTADGLRPATIGGQPGFRFDYSFAGADEVRRRGFAAGAVVEDKLYLVHYNGSSIYHFERNSADAERIVASIQFKKKT